MAQIAAEIRRGLVKNPKHIKVRDFLITFGPPKPKMSSKEIWLAAVGLDPQNPKKKRK